MASLYSCALESLIDEGFMRLGDSILVACGGPHDARTFAKLRFTRVTISNLDDHYAGGCGPFSWQRVDVEDIQYGPGSVDWAVVHAGLHHCGSPHRGLAEMLRIARKGVLVIEARDGIFMRLATRLGLVPEYELEAVVLEGGRTGGLRNGPIPNFIYRWTEREVRKTVEAAVPERVNDIRYFYGLRLPDQRMTMAGPAKRAIAKTAGAILRVAHRLFPRVGTEFGFAVLNTGKLKPWIAEGRLNPSYRLGFDPARYDQAA